MGVFENILAFFGGLIELIQKITQNGV